MAKKKATPKKDNQPGSTQPPLDPEWQEQIPEAVRIHADEYLRQMRLKNKASERQRTAKEKAIEAMKDAGLTRIRIDEGRQWLEVEEKASLVTRKVNLEKDDTRQSVAP